MSLKYTVIQKAICKVIKERFPNLTVMEVLDLSEKILNELPVEERPLF